MADRNAAGSPRITSLKKSLEAGDGSALDSFWQEIAEHGTPLIETIEGDERHVLLTFLWKGQEDTGNVTIIGGPLGLKPARNTMERLLDTNLWYRTCRARTDMLTTYRLAPNDSLVDFADVAPEDWEKRTANFQVDPLNLRTFTFPQDEELPEDKEMIVSVLALPDAPAQPWSAVRPEVPAGQVEMHRFRSTILDNERRVWVYTPPGYTPNSEPYGLLLVFDGLAYIELVPTPTILDNLLYEGKIPPLVAVIPDSLNHETRSRELPCYQPFVDFLTKELLSWAHERYSITSDPAQSIVGGSSFGGLGATFVGLRASSTFGNVLSQSGSFWYRPDWRNPENETEYEWLARQFMEQPKLPIRFYQDVGLLENEAGSNGNPGQLTSNRYMRDILRLKGYDVHYAEYNGGHDYLCWRGTLADGLLALVGKTK